MVFNPKISIVIPVYNGSNYMREAIDSALDQTYNNIEIIVVNDGSDDDGKTEDIAKSYGDKIRYFYKENGGVASALNLGIREMTGEYFSWLSHDDYYLPGKIEKQVRFIDGHRDAKVLFCDTGVMDENGRVLKSKLTTMREFVEDRFPSRKKKQDEIFRGGISFFDAWIYACSLLVHRSCFEKTGFINEQNRTTQDVEFTLLLLHYFDVYSLPELLVYRRDHQASGFYRQRELNIKESERLWKRYLDDYGISFFFPELSESDNSITLAKAYEKLGDSMIGRKEFSSYCYKKSLHLNNSPLNIVQLKMIISDKTLSLIFQLKRKISWSCKVLFKG